MKFVYDLLFLRKNHNSKQYSRVVLILLIGLLGLFGCGDQATSALPTPVGAASSLNTFIFFYTDN